MFWVTILTVLLCVLLLYVVVRFSDSVSEYAMSVEEFIFALHEHEPTCKIVKESKDMIQTSCGIQMFKKSGDIEMKHCPICGGLLIRKDDK